MRSNFASNPTSSIGRLYKEKPTSFRNEYQRDRDRIIHCSAFRRLEYKTQVFVNHEGDMFRTRLTHSIEVSQIARSIARTLGAHEDLAETISLAHDLGHTPFGHAGQDALNKCMKKYGGFEHNLQSLRIVDNLERRYADFNGLNLKGKLNLPHKMMHKRNFVLFPLFEIEKKWVHPIIKKNIKQLIYLLPNNDIRSIKQI